MSTPCRICGGLPCDNPDDLASGIDGALYSALDYSFVVECPTGCQCPAGLFPQTISILASTIPPVIPPINEPGAPIILRLQGCTSLITRTLSASSSQDEITAAAQSMQAEWSGQQSLCLAAQVPGVNCTHADSISICNDAQTGWCGDSTTAGTFCQSLVTTGLSASQIAAATATIKANLNQLARSRNCGGWLCPITVVRTVSAPGNSVVNLFITNVGPKTESLLGLQLCINNGGFTCYPPSPPLPPTSIAPFTGPVVFAGGISPIGVPWEVRNFGSVIFSGFIPNGFTDTITAIIGC